MKCRLFLLGLCLGFRLFCPGDSTFETYLKMEHDLYYHNRFEEAQAACQKALTLNPQSLNTWFELQSILFLKGDFDAAEKLLLAILSKNSNCMTAWDKLAGLYSCERKFEETKKIYEKLLAVKTSDLSHISYCLGLCELMLGNLPRGFALFEHRRAGEPLDEDYLPFPDWDGKIVSGKTLLIYTERGAGDVFQFIRYAQLIKEKGMCVVVLLYQPYLKNILSQCPYVDTLILKGEKLPPADYKVRLMSLPCCYKTTIKTIPLSIPYLFANEKLEKLWKKKLSYDKNFKIGLSWQGEVRRDNPFVCRNTTMRIIPYDTLSRLGKDNQQKISFYNLQKGIEIPQDDQFIVRDFGPDFDKSHGSFMDTAAIMKNLDLVITADTSIAHLAGGLGVPVWVLLPYEAEWRWMIDRDDSPWYPTMKLFRQKERGNWEEVLERVKKELEKLIRP